MNNIKFTGLKNVLQKFDEHDWIGSFSSGNWEISYGGYDLWFELYYKNQPVMQCIDGKLLSDFGLDDTNKLKLFNKVLEEYDHLKINDKDIAYKIVGKNIKSFMEFEEQTSIIYPFAVVFNALSKETLSNIVDKCDGYIDTETIYDAIEFVVGKNPKLKDEKFVNEIFEEYQNKAKEKRNLIKG